MAEDKKKAGRPKGSVEQHTLIARKMRQELVKEVRKEFKPIVKSQIELAKGIYVEKEVVLPNGQKIKKIYKVKPDVKAAQVLLDQSIGKAESSIKVEAEVKTITELVASLEDED